jgi:hypothetical protein
VSAPDWKPATFELEGWSPGTGPGELADPTVDVQYAPGLYRATEDEKKIILWLWAEQCWQRAVVQWLRAEEHHHRSEAERAQNAASFERCRTEHDALVSRASGLRRALLERHRPCFGPYGIYCAGCPEGNYDGESYGADWKCGTYLLAEGWGP